MYDELNRLEPSGRGLRGFLSWLRALVIGGVIYVVGVTILVAAMALLSWSPTWLMASAFAVGALWLLVWIVRRYVAEEVERQVAVRRMTVDDDDWDEPRV
jgi:hypothetical protein